MATKKQTPALFELINKGPLRPDDKGRLATPKWFAKSKTPPVSGAPASVTTAPTAPAPTPSAPAKPPTAPLPATSPIDTTTPATRPVAISSIGRRLPLLSLKPSKLTFSVSYWLIGLAALALIFIVLVAYRLGQINIENRQTDHANAPPSPTMQAIADAAPQAAVLSGTPSQPTPPAPPAAAADSATVQPAPDQTPVSPRTGMCLILVAHSNPRDLSPVQAYFNTKDIRTAIGRRGKNYVLYSQQLFPNSKAAEGLKAQVARLGKDYNRYKSPTAPVFKPETFSQAYLANIDSITR